MSSNAKLLRTKAQKSYQKRCKYVIVYFKHNTIISLKSKSLGTSSKSINYSGWTPKVEPQGGLPRWTPRGPQSWKPLKTIIPVCLCVSSFGLVGPRSGMLLWREGEAMCPGWSHLSEMLLWRGGEASRLVSFFFSKTSKAIIIDLSSILEHWCLT